MMRPRISAVTIDFQSLFLSPAFKSPSVRLRYLRQHATSVQVQRAHFQQAPQTEPPPKSYFQPPSDPPKTYFQPPSDSQPPQPPPPSQPPPYFQSDSQSPPPKPPPPKRPSRLRFLIWSTLFFSTGYFIGRRVTDFSEVSGPELARRIRNLNVEINRLPIVKELRRNPELWQEWVAYSSFTPEERKQRLTSGVLSTLEGVPVQRVFVNKKDGRVVNIVWFGRSVGGWPRIVHGGILATILDETMGRAAVFHLPAQTGVTASLEIAYRAPVMTGGLYVVRADLIHDESSDRKAVVRGSVHTANREEPMTEARALFVVPRSLELGKIKDGF